MPQYPLVQAVSLSCLLSLSPTVFAKDCRESLAAMDPIANTPSYQVVLPEYQELRKAVVLLADSGQAGLCNDVAAEMSALLEQRRAEIGAEQRQEALIESGRLQPLAPNEAVNAMLGQPLHDLSDEELGDIIDVVIDGDSGRVVYVVINYGGSLSFGDPYIAIPWSRLQKTRQGQFVIDAKIGELDKLPDFDKDDYPVIRLRDEDS